MSNPTKRQGISEAMANRFESLEMVLALLLAVALVMKSLQLPFALKKQEQ